MILLEDKHREYKRFRPNPSEKIQLANNGLQWVLSSNVSAIGVSGKDLVIRFNNGSMYQYTNKADLFDAMLNSNSKGHFVWAKLRKPRVPYKKIGSLPFKGDTQVTDEEIFSLVDTRGIEVMDRLQQMGMFIPDVTLSNGTTIVMKPMELFTPPVPKQTVGQVIVDKFKNETVSTIEKEFNATYMSKEKYIDSIEYEASEILSDTVGAKNIKVYRKESIDPYGLQASTKNIVDLSKEYNVKIDNINLGHIPGGQIGTYGKVTVHASREKTLSVIIEDKSFWKLKVKSWEIKKNRIDNYGVVVDIENVDKYVTTHEFGHTFHNFQASKVYKKLNLYNPNEDFGKQIIAIEKKYFKELDELKNQRYSAELEYFGGKIPRNTDKPFEWTSPKAKEIHEQMKQTYISTYAGSNTDEFMAESFTQAKLSKNPSKYAKQVLDVIDKYFKKGV